MSTRLAYGTTKREAAEHGIPLHGVKAFHEHRRSAKRRHIDFLFTLPEWWAWWQVDDRWQDRGMGRDKLVMARNEDAGPYSPENVYCTTHGGNQADVPPERRQEVTGRAHATAKANGTYGSPWKGVRGGHPMARPVVTPLGRFGSAALAAEAHGYHPGYASKKAAAEHGGWRYDAA